MATSSSRPKLVACPGEIVELNETVYELYKPNGVPEVEVLFFHGLQFGDYKDAYWRSWLSRDETVVWPKDWLSEKFPNARILSISYDSCATVTADAGHQDMYNIGENLLHSVILNRESNVGQNCPVVLVGHSFGGLAIKQFVLFAQLRKNSMNEQTFGDDYRRVSNFLTNFCGVFYYSTPHGGSRLADFAAKVPSFKRASNALNVLKTLNKHTAIVNNDFREWRAIQKKLATSITESIPTKMIRGFNAIVVEEAAARQDTDKLMTVAANHIDVCKPEKMTRTEFQSLQNFIDDCMQLQRKPITHGAENAQMNMT